MIEKIIVVAPTTAVPMRTGFAVALNVFPVPSFSSRRCFALSKFTSTPYAFLSSPLIPGICSMPDNAPSVFELSVIEQIPGIKGGLRKAYAVARHSESAKHLLEEHGGTWNTCKATAQ